MLDGSLQAHVLVVDGSASVRRHVTGLLAEEGWLVAAAPDGDRALASAARQRPDLVVLDLMAAGGDGEDDLLDRLLGAAELEGVPVIVSGAASAPELLPALERGAHDVLVKPVDDRELTARCRAALRTKHRLDSARRLAMTDQLTGLPNRRAAQAALRRALAAGTRHGHQAGVLLIDVDGLKRTNDTGGHAAGDALLRDVAAAMSATIRGEDDLSRWGGDEFLLLLPRADDLSVARAARRLRESVGSCGHSVSVGWAVGDEDADDLLVRADQALYAAKRARGAAATG